MPEPTDYNAIILCHSCINGDHDCADHLVGGRSCDCDVCIDADRAAFDAECEAAKRDGRWAGDAA